jgi:hypothetical protein
MKRFTPIALLLLTACTSPFGTLQRIFPDGGSFEVVDAQLIVTGTGGTLTAKSIRSIGTNGFSLLGPTNAAPAQVMVPATIQPGRLKLER